MAFFARLQLPVTGHEAQPTSDENVSTEFTLFRHPGLRLDDVDEEPEGSGSHALGNDPISLYP